MKPTLAWAVVDKETGRIYICSIRMTRQELRREVSIWKEQGVNVRRYAVKRVQISEVK